MKREPTRQKTETKRVKDWNAAYAVGQAVRYWPGAMEGDGLLSKTRTLAQLLGEHTGVVWVEGRGDCIALSHVRVVP